MTGWITNWDDMASELRKADVRYDQAVRPCWTMSLAEKRPIIAEARRQLQADYDAAWAKMVQGGGLPK